MSSVPCVHHVEVGVTDAARAVNILCKNFTFDVVAVRDSKVARQWLLVKQDTRYLLTSLKTEEKKLIQEDDYVIDWMDIHEQNRREDKGKRKRKDSVFNVCLQVDDIEQSLARLQNHNVLPFKDLRTAADSFGCVKMATIKSVVGDVYHTLVEKNNYTGLFLPGFQVLNCKCEPASYEFWTFQDDLLLKDNESCNISNICDNLAFHICSVNSNGCSAILNNDVDSNCTDIVYAEQESDGIGTITTEQSCHEDKNCPVWTTFDHVAFAVEMGTSHAVISWYEKCLGMRRFLVNSEEDVDEGLVLSTDTVSLRLRAMEYWRCAETGLGGPKTDAQGNCLSMVIAEGLPPGPNTKEENQIEAWLRQHGGPGIQHIALNTQNIKETVGRLTQLGAAFANHPPEAYYTEVGRYYDIKRTGEDLETLRRHGILIDTEANSSDCVLDGAEIQGDSKVHERYLLQIFTKPIFPNDPFFMEIIQREGATGFGSGNVAALYRSLQRCLVDRGKVTAR